MKILRRLAFTIVALILVALLGALAFAAKISHDVAATTRARAADLEGFRAQAYRREVHAPPVLPGTFAALANPAFAWLEKHGSEVLDARKACAGETAPGHLLAPAVLRLEAPLPPGCKALAELGWPAVSDLLRATHAERGATPQVLDLGPDHPDAPWMLEVAWIAAIRMVGLLSAHKPDDGLRVCGDLLALGRDLANGSGMLGLGVESSFVSVAFLPCETAIAGASADARAQFRDAVDRVHASLPQLGELFRQEAVGEWLYVPGDSQSLHGPEALLFRDQALRHDRLMLALSSVADQPQADRAAAFQRLAEASAHSWNPLAGIANPDFEKWAERADATQAQLGALRAAAGNGPLPQ